MSAAGIIIGSPEHKEHIRKEAEAHIEQAMAMIADSGEFTEGQTNVLFDVLWRVYYAIEKTV